MMFHAVSEMQVPRLSVAVQALCKCLNIGTEPILNLVEASRHNKTDLLIELRNREKVQSDHRTDRAVAKICKLEFLQKIDPSKIRLRPDATLLQVANLRLVTYEDSPGSYKVLIAPKEMDLPRLHATKCKGTANHLRIAIVNPKVLRNALLEVTKKQRLHSATFDLHQSNPESSCHRTTTAAQGFIFGAALMCAVYCLTLYTTATLYVTHITASVLFFLCVLLRLITIPTLLQKKTMST